MCAPKSTAFHCQPIEPIVSAYFNFQRNSLKLAVDSTSAYSGFHFGLQSIPLWPTITTPKRELCVFQELRKIGFCDYQNVFSRNEEKVNFKVPPVGRKNSDNNISSAKMKFSRNEENVLWILHINNNI